ncbi:MAG: hypothetical protein JZD41_07260, partial [Thermoproteus sp.]|nr:hypothetical protein [Thermoproteus sp.]
SLRRSASITYVNKSRSRGSRTGFEAVRIRDGAKAVLARVGEGEPRVGKYVVDLGACDVLLRALEPSDLLIIDEVGAMEAKCAGFLESARSAVSASSRAFLTVHRNYVGLVKGWGLDVLWLTRENWDVVLTEVLRKLGLLEKFSRKI